MNRLLQAAACAAALLAASTGTAQEVIVESHSTGQNSAYFGAVEGGWLESEARSTAPGLTAEKAMFTIADSRGGTARFTPLIPASGPYEVFVTYSKSGNAAGVIYRVRSADGEHTIIRDQHGRNPNTDFPPDEWNSIGTFRFEAGNTGYIEVTDPGTGVGANPAEPNTRVYVDGVRLVHKPGAEVKAAENAPVPVALAATPAAAAAPAAPPLTAAVAPPLGAAAPPPPAPSLSEAAPAPVPALSEIAPAAPLAPLAPVNAAPPAAPDLGTATVEQRLATVQDHFNQMESSLNAGALPTLGATAPPTAAPAPPMPAAPLGGLPTLDGSPPAAPALGALPALNGAPPPAFPTFATPASPDASAFPGLAPAASLGYPAPGSPAPETGNPFDLSVTLPGAAPAAPAGLPGFLADTAGMPTPTPAVLANVPYIPPDGATPATGTRAELPWLFDIGVARNASMVDNKPVLVFYVADGSRVVEKYDMDYFNDPSVRAVLDTMHLVRLNFANNSRLAYQQNVFGAGAIAIIRADGTVLRRVISVPNSAGELAQQLIPPPAAPPMSLPAPSGQPPPPAQ